MSKATSFFRTLWPAALVLTSLVMVSAGQWDRPVPVILPPLPAGGLQMSLSTNVYRVFAGDTAVQSRAGSLVARPAREVLIASVQLANRSAYDLTFTLQ